MSAYIIFNYVITDRERIQALSSRSKACDARSPYKPDVIVATAADTVEGNTLPHLVIYEFDTLEMANGWYYDEATQDVATLRKAITDGWVSIVPGYR